MWKAILVGPTIVVGIGLMLTSQAKTPVLQAIDYTSTQQVTYVEVPQPTQSILYWGGVLLICPVSPWLLFQWALERKRRVGQQTNLSAFGLEEEDNVLVASGVRALSTESHFPITSTSNNQLPLGPYGEEEDYEDMGEINRQQEPWRPGRTTIQQKSFGNSSKGPNDFVEENICLKMASSDKSSLVASAPRSGKSTIIKGMLVALFDSFPQATVRIVDAKKRRWMGLENVRGAVVAPTRGDYSPLVEVVTEGADELSRRQELSEAQVRNLSPYVIILDDYLSLYSNLNVYVDKQSRDRFSADINSIITVGPEFKVRLVFISHSPNAAELGISAPVRRTMSLFVLGRLDRRLEGQEDGGFAAIRTVLEAAHLLQDAEQRRKLGAMLPAIEAASIALNRSAFYTDMGRPRLALTPDLSWLEGYEFEVGEREDYESEGQRGLEGPDDDLWGSEESGLGEMGAVTYLSKFAAENQLQFPQE